MFKSGALSRGVREGLVDRGVDDQRDRTAETADGMSLSKIHRITELMRHERYRFSPVERVMIPKKNGKLRPLGLPGWSDKLVGEVMRLLLEAYKSPRAADRSKGSARRGAAAPHCGR